MIFGAGFDKVEAMEPNNEPKPEMKPITVEDHQWAEAKVNDLIEEAAAWSDTVLWWAWNMGWLK